MSKARAEGESWEERIAVRDRVKLEEARLVYEAEKKSVIKLRDEMFAEHAHMSKVYKAMQKNDKLKTDSSEDSSISSDSDSPDSDLNVRLR
jgi:hypothetical protein